MLRQMDRHHFLPSFSPCDWAVTHSVENLFTFALYAPQGLVPLARVQAQYK